DKRLVRIFRAGVMVCEFWQARTESSKNGPGRTNRSGEAGAHPIQGEGHPMGEFFSTWHPGTVLALVAVSGLFLTVLVAVVSGNRRRVRQAQIAADLKRELIQKGYTVEDILRLVAGPPGEEDGPVNEKELVAQLALLLVQHEVPGPALEEVLRTYQATDP